MQALRQVFVQNYFLDHRDQVQWREPKGAGLPPSALAVVSPYDLTARFSRRNITRGKGFLAHVTETCDDDMVNIVTDVTTTSAARYDIKALPTIHARLEQRNLLPAEHLVDAGYTSVPVQEQVAREHDIVLMGPVRRKVTCQSRKGNVFDRDAFTIDFEQEQVTCPQGKTSRDWAAPPSITSYIRAKFDKDDCGQCPVKSSCTRAEARQTMFLPEPLYERRARARAAQETEQWKGALRHAGRRREHHQRLHPRPRHAPVPLPRRRQDHVQHVLTAIAVNIERINAHQTDPDHGPRPPTTLQKFLDWRGFPRQRGRRNAGS